MIGSQVLADQGRGRVAQSPGRHNHKDDHTDGDGVSGQRRRTENAHDAQQADPTGVSYGKLQNSSQRHPDQAGNNIELQAYLPLENAEALGAFHQPVELVGHADAASSERRKSRSRYAQAWERSPAEDQAGIEDQVDDVRNP